MENWKPVVGFENIYEVSDLGRVRSLDRIYFHQRNGPTRYKGRLLKPTWTTGYAVVGLSRGGSVESLYVHDLVLRAFIGRKPVDEEVCHGPAGERVNALTNLRYDTRQANALDRHLWGEGWKKRGNKDPLEVLCVICSRPVFIFRRKNRPFHLCGSEHCRSEWGRESQRRK
jgi:hypothetical protein